MAAKKIHDLPPSYANLGYDSEPVAGPSAPNVQSDTLVHGCPVPQTVPTAPVSEDNTHSIPEFNPPSLVFENIYEACAHYLDDHCCYGRRFINQMKLTNIHNTRVLRYKLDSYGEMRETEDSYRSYRGGTVDAPENGPPPHPWDIVVQRPDNFEDTSRTKQIPHTERVSTCPRCDGRGEETCYRCDGRAYVECYRCNGRGKDDEDNSCWNCSGRGEERCSRCTNGKVTCGKCDGYKKIVEYKRLKVTWTKHSEEFTTNTFNLPKDLIHKEKPAILFMEKKNKVQPIVYSDETVNQASIRLLRRHENAFPNELIIRQRHSLVAFPLTKVAYEWKDKNGEFYVYGPERKAYFEEYPQPYCCCVCC